MTVLSAVQLQTSLEGFLSDWDRHCAVWVFGYGSLIWHPEFTFDRRVPARIFGLHRRLCLWSRVYRGTPNQPGLVLGLAPGGSCHGMLHRIPGPQVREQLDVLWRREMVSGAYEPRWLRAHTASGSRPAQTRCIAFVMDPRSSGYACGLSDQSVMRTIKRAHGSRGSNVDYVLTTARCLEEHGIADRQLTALARRLRG